MFNIKIDISAPTDLFGLSPKEIDSLHELTVIAFVNEAYDNIVELATKRLNMTRNAYIEALQIKQEDRFTYSLNLTGSAIANMVEDGSSSFDMKEGFSKSSKIKRTKGGGWYLTIPFKFRTTAANPTSGNAGSLLPRRIYDLIRNTPDKVTQTGNAEVSILKNESIPERYQPSSVINELTNKAKEYIPKSSIYAGIIRTKDVEKGLSTYNTFRRVSNNSDPKSWIHPGIQAYNLFDEGFNNTSQETAILDAVEKLFVD